MPSPVQQVPFLRPVVSLDCTRVIDTGNRILDDLPKGLVPLLPTENTDLWAFFLEGVQGTYLQDVALRWVRGHVDWRKCANEDKVDAWFNHYADQVAGSSLHWCSRHCGLYRQLIREFRSNRNWPGRYLHSSSLWDLEPGIPQRGQLVLPPQCLRYSSV